MATIVDVVDVLPGCPLGFFQEYKQPCNRNLSHSETGGEKIMKI